MFLYVTAILVNLMSVVTPKCVPIQPCRTCNYVTVERDTTDCSKYFYCYHGRVGPSLRCGVNQIYSITARQCQHRNTTDECRPHTVVDTAQQIYTTHLPWLSASQRTTTKRYISSPPLATPQFRANCGIRTANWIVGGEISEPGEWPWQVSVQSYHSRRRGFVHICGGTLVHELWVVTAAHCLHGRSPGTVLAVMGAYNLTSAHPSEQKRIVVRLATFPKYKNYGNHPHDIALLRLSSPVRLSRDINIACLTSQGEEPESKYTLPGTNNTRCWVTGWGMTSGKLKVQIPSEVKVDLKSQDECKKKWGAYVSDFHICAGGGDTGACRGDSGGPLVCTANGRFFLEGVVSWGEDTCLLKGYPNVFTRVSWYAGWIRHTIEQSPDVSATVMAGD